MPTTPISNATGITTGTTPTASPQLDRKDQFGKDTFLKLLVAQMKYQNPMQPTDPTSFLTQSAQFSVVEKLSQLATQSEVSTKLTEMTTAASFVGKRVSYAKDGVPSEGVVDSVKFLPGLPPMLVIGDTEVAITDIQGVDAGPKT